MTMKRRLTVLSIATLLLLAVTVSANTLTVARVHPGAIVEFEGGFRVRLLGVRIPPPRTQIGYQAYDFVKRRLEGKLVKVFTWTTDDTAGGIVYGDDGLPFATILYGAGLESDIAAELLQEGYATVDSAHQPDDVGHYDQIEARAQAENLGLWFRD